MHANCCKGLNNKVNYLNAARWRRRHRCGRRVR
ncbi:BnaA09g17320D [Brassica napus]|uniref:BnaA09g17320D protein n=1 Tax=Brassica napus TaxID=3708 RepID=A0A078FFE2_BRANA|nr:BnaA09g17320D [Brassica napus]